MPAYKDPRVLALYELMMAQEQDLRQACLEALDRQTSEFGVNRAAVEIHLLWTEMESHSAEAVAAVATTADAESLMGEVLKAREALLDRLKAIEVFTP